MSNDTLDEIEARWKHAFAPPDIRTLIEMVRARDRIVEAARVIAAEHYVPTPLDWWKLQNRLAALDTPPAQEPTE